jgi:hypothetical protein
MTAWLHFLEPIARDWGRVKGGLTPWRLTPKAINSNLRATRWWQRLHPFGRTVRWDSPGSAELDKHNFLHRLTEQLSASRYSVGWNSDWQDWDLKIRRGALGEVLLRMLVEYHGGPRRTARFSAKIRPLKLVSWLQGGLVAWGTGMGILGLLVPFTACIGLLAFLWIGSIAEANRLEAGVLSAWNEVLHQLKRERLTES